MWLTPSLPSGRTRHTLRTLFYYPEASTKSPRPTAWLDGLRGVAAFEVLIYHWHLQFWSYALNPGYGSLAGTEQWWRLPFIRNLVCSGHTMVNVFFLISGFVLTHRSLTLIQSQNYDKLYPSISSAIFRRSIRLYLPTCIVSFLGMLLAFFRGKNAGMEHLQKETFFAQIIDWIYACRDFANPFHDYNDSLDILHRYQAVFWTLPLELYGSIVCYVTVMAVARVTHPIKRSAIIAIIAWFAFVKANWWSLNFLAGMLFAEFSIWQDKTETKWSKGTVAKSFWIVLFIWASYIAGLPDSNYNQYSLPGFDWYYDHIPEGWEEAEGGGRLWWMISGICLTVSISQLPTLKRMFESGICQYLGRISFMLYLVHPTVFEAVGRWWKDTLMHLCSVTVTHAPGLYDTSFQPDGIMWYIWYLGFWIVMIPLVFMISGQVTKYVDDPSIEAAKWLERKALKDDRVEYTNSVPMSMLAS